MTIRFSIQYTECHILEYKRQGAPKNKYKEDSKFMASLEHVTQEEFLDKNIRGINQEINKHVQEIRKTLKRIQSHTHYVVTAQEILDEIEKKT